MTKQHTVNPFKCKCGNSGSPTCVRNYCRHCCDGLNCVRHPKQKKVKPINVRHPKQKKVKPIKKPYKKPVCLVCEKNEPTHMCINKNCSECCENISCKIHFIECECGDKVSLRKACGKTKSCSGKCCTDSHCNFHFDTDEHLQIKDFNDFKVRLYKCSNLPVRIISIIVDEYLDNRIKCSQCDYKFDDLNDAIACHHCDKWVCWYDDNCSRTNNDLTLCLTCYDQISSDDVFEEVDDDDDEVDDDEVDYDDDHDDGSTFVEDFYQYDYDYGFPFTW